MYWYNDEKASVMPEVQLECDYCCLYTTSMGNSPSGTVIFRFTNIEDQKINLIFENSEE